MAKGPLAPRPVGGKGSTPYVPGVPQTSKPTPPRK